MPPDDSEIGVPDEPVFVAAMRGGTTTNTRTLTYTYNARPYDKVVPTDEPGPVAPDDRVSRPDNDYYVHVSDEHESDIPWHYRDDRRTVTDDEIPEHPDTGRDLPSLLLLMEGATRGTVASTVAAGVPELLTVATRATTTVGVLVYGPLRFAYT